MSSKSDRRKFLKYVGAGLVAAAAGGAGYYLYGKQPTYPTTPTQTVTIPKGWETASTYLKNNPPVASFTRRPYYLNPTDQQTIQFTNTSTDPDGDQLSTTWIIDHVEVSRERDYSTKLAEGEHWVTMRVSDGREEASAGDHVTVDPDQIYPARPLQMRYKGTSYYVGNIMPEGPNVFPTEEETDEQLDTIHNDLGCNSVIITGGDRWEDKIINCGKIAAEKGFERVYIQPRYVNYTVDETIERIREFAPKVRDLRETCGDIVGFCFGHEFLTETAIIRGSDFFERWKIGMKGVDWDRAKRILPEMFKKIIAVCKEDYGYPVTYAAMPAEAHENLVPWSDPAFEAIGVDTYITEAREIAPDVNDENWWFSLLSRLKRFRKPVLSCDWGMMSYKDADKWGGLSPLMYAGELYDEEPQVKYMTRILDMLNRVKIDGCFWIDYNDAFPEGHGLYNPVTRKRKKGFYMYKSYQRSP